MMPRPARQEVLTLVNVTHHEAVSEAVRYTRAAEAADAGGQPANRDVNLAFAQVWAHIAIATKESE